MCASPFQGWGPGWWGEVQGGRVFGESCRHYLLLFTCFFSLLHTGAILSIGGVVA